MCLVVRSAKFARTRPRRLHGQCASLIGPPGLHDAKGHCVEKPGMVGPVGGGPPAGGRHTAARAS